MAYQPLYGRCWDNQVGDGHTSSLRGTVNNVGLSCNTFFGNCIDVNVRYIDGKQQVDRPDFRKVKKTERTKAMEEYENKVDEETKVIVNINTEKNRHFIYELNGLEINEEMLNLMRRVQIRGLTMDCNQSLAAIERMLEAAERESVSGRA